MIKDYGQRRTSALFAHTIKNNKKLEAFESLAYENHINEK